MKFQFQTLGDPLDQPRWRPNGGATEPVLQILPAPQNVQIDSLLSHLIYFEFQIILDQPLKLLLFLWRSEILFFSYKSL